MPAWRFPNGRASTGTMTTPSGLTEQDRANLVAYLDGELTDEEARALEVKLSINPRARAEAEALKRTWDMLDYLPRTEPSTSFTHRTLSRIHPAGSPTQARPAARRRRERVLVAGWLLAIVACAAGGYLGYNSFVPWQPGERELVRDLRLIENKHAYDLIEDIEFLRQLDQPDLFGEDGPGD